MRRRHSWPVRMRDQSFSHVTEMLVRRRVDSHRNWKVLMYVQVLFSKAIIIVCLLISEINLCVLCRWRTVYSSRV